MFGPDCEERLQALTEPKRAFTNELRQAWRSYEDDEGEESTTVSKREYYRGEAREVAEEEMLFEFFIPLYDPSKVSAERVSFYRELMTGGRQPTAVALSVLDVKSSMEWPEDSAGEEVEPRFGTHWCLANYILDGHHKIRASHETGLPITLLSFMTIDHSWKQLDAMLSGYQRNR